MRIGSNREAQIQQICHERGIKTLVHFTRVENLSSILQNGLLSREALETRGQQFLFNDPNRNDGHKDAICLSISFPNYQMFCRIKDDKKKANEASDSQWVVLLLDGRVLWELKCAFCQRNAAHQTVRKIPLEDRKKPGALKGMFEDFYNIKHQDLQIPNNYPTHPQAEILVFNQIPVRYINAVHFSGSTVLAQWRSDNPIPYSQKFAADPKYFQPRTDWKEWRPAHFNSGGIPLSYFADDGDDRPWFDEPPEVLVDVNSDDIPFYNIPESDEYLGEFVGEDNDDIPF